jgi:predicted dehydrogenase
LPPVGFAVVGLGTLATTAILPAFRGMQRAKLVALVSRDIEKARRLMTAYRKCFEPSTVLIRNLILSGRLGALKMLHTSRRR